MWLLTTALPRPTLVSKDEDELDQLDPDDSGTRLVKYAIVSHRWEKDNSEEVTFEEMHGSSKPLPKTNSLGYLKILECCRLAREHDPKLDYLWIDTCCIDKRSSAELQEAINSMFYWSVEWSAI
jgi:hypothetical protein